jgi:hypothetical protein
MYVYSNPFPAMLSNRLLACECVKPGTAPRTPPRPHDVGYEGWIEIREKREKKKKKKLPGPIHDLPWQL